jgi:hypothetical protein
MRRLHRRVAKIEDRCFGGRAVARIVSILQRASDEELYWLVKDGRVARMVERLSERELGRLIAETKALIDRYSCRVN